MESTHGLPLEVRLSAYLDGQLPDEEISEIDRLLVKDPKARSLFERLKLGSDFGARAFEEMLHDPVPLDLVRGIKHATPAPELPGETASLPPLGASAANISWPRVLAASFVLLLAGGAAGYLVGERREAVPPVQLAAGRGWLDDIADYHRIYSRQKAHLVEVPASDGPHIVEWLSAAVGVTFTLPDLSNEELVFEGARLLVAGGRPTAQLLYSDPQGDVFAICFLKSDPVEAATALTDSMKNDIGLVSWQKGSASYVVVGPSSDPALEKIAETVAATI
ncbi:anti-sigma factor [Rhizobium sp. TRM95111]|uniref:anti-sigma factor family protein n=1 Tax=Rhizobium alarense TaxID=2846851 RepID=UPI001F17084E|nr:anti-sigma factor [Rhizobium alarense]MCF3641641.1 anti-sigma factor [Rhizobium alarense]